MSDKLKNSLNYLGWQHIAGAVLDVFRENQKRQKEEEGLEASADVWSIVDHCRQEIHQRVRDAWCVRSGADPSYFPYSVDCTARLYFRFRKRNADEIAEFAAEIRRASGQTGFFPNTRRS